jgi:hypothetical protein
MASNWRLKNERSRSHLLSVDVAAGQLLPDFLAVLRYLEDER